MSHSTYTHKAKDYAAYRPAYPIEAIEVLVEQTGLQSDWIVADIGSGTGNVSRFLLDRVRKIYAVEPDPGMRQEAERLLGRHAGFESVAATAEQTTLADQSIDLITIGQALHWFDFEAAQAEFERILKPGRLIVLIWHEIGSWPETVKETLPLDAQQSWRFPGKIEADFEKYLGGLRSGAAFPNIGDMDYPKYEANARVRFAERAVNGVITTPFMTEIVIGRLSQ